METKLDKQANFTLKLDIIFENEDFLVINKPADLIVHPVKSLAETTLVSVLLKKYPGIKNVGENCLRPGIIHRLDKNVSGLLIIAKNQKTFDYFKKQFQLQQIIKEYFALVHGQVSKETGIINLALARDKNGKMTLAKSAHLGNIKESWTEYKILKKLKNFTLLKIKIKTGRTHQIRLHLKSIGHSIVGDDLHKIKRQKKVTLKRIFLHAFHLSFIDL
ncbi:MAG: RNA pseudouridine synthase, partial [Bacteroidetes bacterium]|nr:RNA pseudouridine synthase [Bacteroidota bacterium]